MPASSLSGGGVIGTSTAYHLAKAGWSDILVLERDKLTSGTTWHAAGLIASSGMATETLAWIAKYTREIYQGLEAETGISTGFHQCGRHRKVNRHRSKMLRAAFAYADCRRAISFHVCLASGLSSR